MPQAVNEGRATRPRTERGHRDTSQRVAAVQSASEVAYPKLQCFLRRDQRAYLLQAIRTDSWDTVQLLNHPVGPARYDLSGERGADRPRYRGPMSSALSRTDVLRQPQFAQRCLGLLRLRLGDGVAG